MKESEVDFLCCLLSDVIVSGLAGKETAKFEKQPNFEID